MVFCFETVFTLISLILRDYGFFGAGKRAQQAHFTEHRVDGKFVVIVFFDDVCLGARFYAKGAAVAFFLVDFYNHTYSFLNIEVIFLILPASASRSEIIASSDAA
jgi:hypothetical protein